MLSCALLTTEPNDKIAKLHDRMPVILEESQWDLWLNNTSTYQDLNTLFKPSPSENISYFRVSDLVNSVKNDSAECISENLEVEPRQGTLF